MRAMLARLLVLVTGRVGAVLVRRALDLPTEGAAGPEEWVAFLLELLVDAIALEVRCRLARSAAPDAPPACRAPRGGCGCRRARGEAAGAPRGGSGR